jgi:prolipoprotein diacylglyceryl transferase
MMPFAAPGVLADIPSPSSGVLEIGPLSIHAYGLMIALGVVAAVWLAGRRLEEKRVGTREDMSAVAIWAVPAGVIGARLYHVATDWELFSDDLARIPQIWRGGLGIPGGIVGGTIVGLWRGSKRGIRPADLADCAAPALPLAQAIGRIGNYFNQELFGKPTDLPWALEVREEKAAQAGYPTLPGEATTTFHPTFLYESLWNLALVAALLLVDRKWKVRPGSLFAMYLIGYGIGRFWVEGLRIDPADSVGGLRLNQWVAVVLIVAGLAYLLVMSGRPVPERAAGEEPVSPPAEPVDTIDDPGGTIDDPVGDAVDADAAVASASGSDQEPTRRYVAEDG